MARLSRARREKDPPEDEETPPLSEQPNGASQLATPKAARYPELTFERDKISDNCRSFCRCFISSSSYRSMISKSNQREQCHEFCRLFGENRRPSAGWQARGSTHAGSSNALRNADITTESYGSLSSGPSRGSPLCPYGRTKTPRNRSWAGRMKNWAQSSGLNPLWTQCIQRPSAHCWPNLGLLG